MKYVYLLETLTHPSNRYVGMTRDLKRRLKEHNVGKLSNTKAYKPWKIVVAVRFEDEHKAHAFEKYLKTGSGRAFVKRHF